MFTGLKLVLDFYSVTVFSVGKVHLFPSIMGLLKKQVFK